jgi:hypothetical protein
MSFFLSPGVYPTEKDLSQRVAAIGTSTGACVFGSRKGSLDVTYKTTGNKFTSEYGIPDPSWSPAHDCVLAFLDQAPVYCKRVINGATWAGLVVLNNENYNQSPSVTQIAEFATGGATDDYKDGAGSRNYYNLTFNKDLVASNVFTINISDGINTLAVTQNYTTSHDSTMTAIASTLTSNLNTFFGSTGWSVSPILSTGMTNDYRQLRISAPDGGDCYFSNASVTGGTQQAIVTISNDCKLFDVYANNPGAWASSTDSDGVGIKIVDVDVGTQQQQTITFDSALIELNQFAATIDGNPITRYSRTITFSADFVALNQIDITVNGRAISTVTYTSNNAYTYALVQKALQTILNSSDSIGYDPVAHTVTITSFSSTDIGNVEVTYGTSQPSATIGDSSLLQYVPFCQNNDRTLLAIGLAFGQQMIGTPATADATNYKIAVSKIAGGFFPIVLSNATLTNGTSQVSVAITQDGITFGGSLITGNVFNCTVNGYSIDPVYFHTSNAQTLTDIATNINKALAAQLGNVVNSGSSSVSLARQVTVSSPFSTSDVTIAGVSLLGGSTQANVTIATTLTRVAATGQFTFEVYTRENTNTPQERYRVSLNEQQDGSGNQLNISDVVNVLTESAFVHVYQPTTSANASLYPHLNSDNRWVVTDSIVWLANGSDGNTVTSSNVIAGWNSLSNTDKYSIRILINGGYTTVAVQQTMESLASTRRDCIAVLDMPEAYQSTSTKCVNYRKNILNISSSYASLYTPDLQIYDEYSGKVRYIPPSGHIAATYAYTDNNYACWSSPGGLNRGNLNNIQGLRYDYDKDDRDLMSPNQVNAIILKHGKYVAWDDQTLQSESSALSNVHVRRLLILIETSLVNALDYKLFDPNDSFTRFQIIQMVNSFLKPIKDARGLYKYLVVCDDTNNSDDTVAAGQLNCDVYLDPVIQVRAIKLQSIIVKTGASFSELIAAGAAS